MSKKQVLILMTLCVSMLGFSQTFIDNFITYQVITNSSNVTITDYDATGGTIVNIPATVTNNNNTYDVTIINTNAFNGKGLTSVTIANSVTTIGTVAFVSNQLTNITIPSSVTSIGSFAFQNNPLADVTTLATTPPAITTGGNNDSFAIDRSGIDLIVPTGATADYLSNGWMGFNSVTETGSAQIGDTFIDNFITYEVTSLNPNNVEATDYDTAGGGTVNIPASVVYSGVTFTVNSIAGNAFVSKSLTAVTMTDSVESIGFLAFRNNQITTLTLSNNLTSIGVGAFQNNALTSIAIPNNMTSISSNCFENNQLTNITIPANITNIQTRAFTGNPLATITSLGTTPAAISTAPPPNTTTDSFSFDRTTIDLIIPSGTSTAYVVAGWTGFNSVTETGGTQIGDTFVDNFITYEITSLSPDEVAVIDYDNTNGPTNVVIPASVTFSSSSFSVTSVGNGAFFNNGISSIDLPNSLVSIGDDAFRLNQITSLTITPNTVISIGDRAFRSNQITSLVIPNGVTHLGDRAFAQNLLTSVDIADSVTTIGGFMFWQNSFTDMSNVIFPFGTTIIPVGMFYENPFTNVVIPDGITGIGDIAFEENQIATVTLPASLITIGENAFKDNQISNITIPNGVTSIGDGAFTINQLSNVTLPNSVTSIGENTFNNNPLISVTSENTTPPTVVTGSEDSFAANRSGIDLIIPTGTTSDYLANGWTGFNTVTEANLSTSDFELFNNVKIITRNNQLNIVANDNIQLNNYEVYTLNGAKITTGNAYDISTESWAIGIYILKLDFDRGTVTKKILIY